MSFLRGPSNVAKYLTVKTPIMAMNGPTSPDVGAAFEAQFASSDIGKLQRTMATVTSTNEHLRILVRLAEIRFSQKLYDNALRGIYRCRCFDYALELILIRLFVCLFVCRFDGGAGFCRGGSAYLAADNGVENPQPAVECSKGCGGEGQIFEFCS